MPADHFTPSNAKPSPWQRLARAAMGENWLLRLAFIGMMIVYARTVFFDFVYDDVRSSFSIHGCAAGTRFMQFLQTPSGAS